MTYVFFLKKITAVFFILFLLCFYYCFVYIGSCLGFRKGECGTFACQKCSLQISQHPSSKRPCFRDQDNPCAENSGSLKGWGPPHLHCPHVLCCTALWGFPPQHDTVVSGNLSGIPTLSKGRGEPSTPKSFGAEWNGSIPLCQQSRGNLNT